MRRLERRAFRSRLYASKPYEYHEKVDLECNGSKNGGGAVFRSPYGRLWNDKPNLKLTKRRKVLFGQRVKACDFSLVFALIGIICTIFEAELVANNVTSRSGTISHCLRGAIALTTFVLIVIIIWYHAIELQICVIDSGARDWQVAITAERIVQLTFEVAVCSISPFPNNLLVNMVALQSDHRQIRAISVPLDTVLSIPMFLRLYLFCRFMAIHSRQFQDAATRSIASLNRVSVNFTFVLKTLMHEHPLKVLCGFTLCFWIFHAILKKVSRLTVTFRYDGVPEDYKYLNALWFIMITFKSVGYGDIVPDTYCGRVMAITTGIVGAAVSSALIAVIGMKLELSKAEKHVNNFMTDSKLSRLRKETAAKVLQNTWFIHKYRDCQTRKDEMKLRLFQRKFLASIYEFRKVKWDQRKLAEQGNALVDLAKLQSETHSMIWTMQQNLNDLTSKVIELNYRLDAILLPYSRQQSRLQRHADSIEV
uniref:Calmodulin-binding domain-containing protein n=1 Tax=Romanomermis culicivorax TaxID=13658 RepID=A0A915HNI5_ROMCU